jgi:ubiquinone/menaquinone biosynthesis C-methylase UbiE
MSSSQVQAFEDQRWAEHDQVPVWRHEAALQLVLEEPVLDVAGGDGLFLSLLQKIPRFSHLTLMDLSPVGVEKARSKGLEATIADITQPFPFDDDSFGTACALDVLEHLYDPLPTLKEMGRVAKSVVLVVPNFHYWKGRLQMLLGQVPFQCKPQRGHIHWFNYMIFTDLITQAGLEVEAVILGGIRRLGPIGNCLARCHPNLFADSFAVRAKKP